MSPIVVLDFPRSDRCDIEDWIAAVEAINTVGQLPSARIAVLASFAENLPEEQSALFLENGVVPLMELDVALPAVASLANWQAPMTQPVWLPHQAHAEENLVLVDEADGALEAAKSFSQTMVLKGLGAAHKSEAGWVALNLNDAEQVYDAAISMTPAPAQWLLEDMVTDVIVELLLGVVHDPAHGYVLTIGAGGVLTELLSDSVSLLLPVTATDIEQALNSLIIAPQLNGYRSSAAVDMSAIIEQVLALQRFVEHHQHKLHEVEINPLLCSATSAIAADALLRILAETPV